MQKQTPLIFALFVMMLSAAPLHVSLADTSLSMAEITKALQSEYQTQLKKTHRAPLRKSSKRTKARSRAERDILSDYQRLLNPPRPVKQQSRNYVRPVPRATSRAARPVAPKAPVADAEDLFNAASNGDVNTISRLLQEGVNINAANRQRETALHMAAARGRYSTVIFLINNGANPFSRTVKQWLPIHHATRFRHANIVRYLMQRGLSPRSKTSDGYSAIDMARTNNDRQLLNIFGVR